jgi:hypothetical protein
MYCICFYKQETVPGISKYPAIKRFRQGASLLFKIEIRKMLLKAEAHVEYENSGR